MRTRSALFLLSPLLSIVLSMVVGCHQPPADLTLHPGGAADQEPSGLAAPAVFVEAPRVADPGPVLDWTSVDDRYASLIDGERYRVDYDVDHPWLGATAPVVTIVVFSDYQCPYCALVNGHFEALVQAYPDDLRVVWRQFPLAFHPQAELASRYALAAQAQGMFAAMHARLFANSKSLTPANIELEASAIGLDLLRLHADLDSEWIQRRLAADKQFAQTLDVNATPVFFINGRPTRGAVDRATIEATVQAEIALAQRLVAAGAERREVWARILAASPPGPVDWNLPNPAAGPAPTPTPNKRYATQLTGIPTRGASPAKIEILMCGDFDCPYSKKSLATLDELRKRYPKDLSVSFRHMPLPMHPNARPAHRAAVAADNQGEFWAMFELLYADPKQRNAADLEAMATQAKLDLARFRADLADPQTEAVIDQQSEYCQQQLDAHGTPSFFINGRPLSGAQPVERFEAIIAEELASAP